MSTASNLPLSGVKILDLSRLLPGPFATQLLADFGADVIKIEDMGQGDYTRLSPPYYEEADGSAKSAPFIGLNRNKRSIRLDLKSEAGVEALRKLVADADVLLETFRPGVMDRLGVGYEALTQINPGLIYCALTGYGQDGPLAQKAGHDLNYLALNGLLSISGDKDTRPMQAGGQIADISGAQSAALGIMLALRERDGSQQHPGSGAGQFIDVSLWESSMSWLAMSGTSVLADGNPIRRGEDMLGGSIACYRTYETSDGQWISMGAIEPKFWQSFCGGIDRNDLLNVQGAAPGSPEHQQLVEVFKSKTRDEWEAFSAQYDCCLEPVLGVDEALTSEATQARNMVVEIDQPGVTTNKVRVIANPIKLSRTAADHQQLPAPSMGEHTAQVLSEAGYSAEQIEEMASSGAIGLQI